MSGKSLARTFGNQIAIDASAAGHGWFIDPTPLSNEEFLPTADPNVWKAKEGTAAAGRMDLLSVLLHEYGHALGLQHSDESHEAMAATLAPGVRRLPTPDELALMSQLVAQLRAGETPPSNPLRDDHQDPALPNGQRTSTTRVARRFEPSRDPNNAQDNPQFATAVNGTLTNGDFGTDGAAGWVTGGEVQAEGDRITLTESARGHTRLSQGFMVGENDRLLSFTMVGRDLHANGRGPADAFEVALLNANTGLPVAGTVDLSRSDALLNLQTDGIERLAAGVRKVVNADGSATYYVGLPQALAGEPVMLSFDLLGFGDAESRVTLRDVRLSGTPVAYDDAATGDEDTAITGSLTANDLTAGSAIARVELVLPPALGTVTLENDGRFRYLPASNAYGADSFSYRIVDADGQVSNTATVSLVVRPVNDAPVARNAAVVLAEDSSITLDLKALVKSPAAGLRRQRTESSPRPTTDTP